MILSNISSDKVQIADFQSEIFLDRNDLDQTLWPNLNKLFQEKKSQKVFLINGPGGFTNLRVATLAWNLIAHLLDTKGISIEFFSITKIDLYAYFVKKWILPPIWYIYLWQKNAIWEYDFQKNSYNVINQPFVFVEDCFIDFVSDLDYFWNLEKMLKISLDKDWLFLFWNWKKHYFDLEDLALKASPAVKPEYFINPF